MFDIITPDLESGTVASMAEILALLEDMLKGFPTLSDHYEIHISHARGMKPFDRQ